MEGKVSSLLANAEKKDFASLKKGHIAAYRSLFGRVELDLGHSSREDLPMDERLAAFHETQTILRWLRFISSSAVIC